jgi:hypothetical protein
MSSKTGTLSRRRTASGVPFLLCSGISFAEEAIAG